MTLENIHPITVGVLALQGAFSEHVQLLRKAATQIQSSRPFQMIEVRTTAELGKCDALIIPGGESTTMSLVAERSGMLEPLREFVKISRKPVWGTCAGMILLAEEANRVKKGGQELIGGLDVRVNRNHFGRQVESFETDLTLPFLPTNSPPFHAVFIRAPIVESILHSSDNSNETVPKTQDEQGINNDSQETTVQTVRAPSKSEQSHSVEIMAQLPKTRAMTEMTTKGEPNADAEESTIVAVMQGNCFGTSFHPELSTDARIHKWWLERVVDSLGTKAT